MKLIEIIKSIFFELLIIFILIFCYNNFLGKSDTRIVSDGVGYYEYLPSIFIHNDIVRKDLDRNKDTAFFKRIDNTGIYHDFETRYRINKYPCGTALLLTPFFIYTLFKAETVSITQDGYEHPFQMSVYYAALFYLFLTLIFIKKTLQLYKIKPWIIFLSQLLLILGTNITLYAEYNASFSHSYSIFAVTAFIYTVKNYFTYFRKQHLIWSCLILGVIFLLRNLNIIIILFIPFLAGSPQNLWHGLVRLTKNKVAFLMGILCMFSIISIQCILWYLQTGKFIVYSYTNETFDFAHPQFLNILFSYRKGQFLYTPITFIASLGLFFLIYKKYFYLFTTWLSFFCILTYIFSSWWCWFYGCSFGPRPYIDFYAMFFILFALVLNEINLWLKIPICLISLATVPINLIQTYQYTAYILTWQTMDKEKYWKVFLKYSDNYKGLIWKHVNNYTDFVTVYEAELPDIKIIPKSSFTVFYKINCTSIPEYNNVSVVHITFTNEFSEDDYSRIELIITDTIENRINYYHNPYTTLFADDKLNLRQNGHYDYDIMYIQKNNSQEISVRLFAPDEKKEYNYTSVRISFLRRK